MNSRQTEDVIALPYKQRFIPEQLFCTVDIFRKTVQFSLMKNTTVLYIQFYTHTFQTKSNKPPKSPIFPEKTQVQCTFKLQEHTTTDWSTLQWMDVKNREASQSENEGRKWNGNCAVWTCEMQKQTEVYRNEGNESC